MGFVKKLILFFLVFSCLFISFGNNVFAAEKKIDVKLFHSSSCSHCIDIKEGYLPKVNTKYKDKIKIEIEYLNIAEQENFKSFLAAEQRFGVKAKVPSILIGNHFLVGSGEIKSKLETILEDYILVPLAADIQTEKPDLLNKFRSFSPIAIILAGLIDGINPCAFTVIIFFISFLTLMGYKKKEVVGIGCSFIMAVFLTYLAIGLGLFRGLYELKHFYSFLKWAYFVIACLCFVLAYLNLRDFFEYRRTKNSDALRVKLPKVVRNKINSIIAMFYRKGQSDHAKPFLTLVASAFVVGFLVSLLEAVCTGQVYLPTIVFILKEPSLRIRAVTYLLLYNFMFIAPLLVILAVAVLGTSSKKIEEFFRNRISLIKLLMFVLFLGLGIFLLIGV